MSKVTVSITQDDIDEGCRCDADNCPGALAISRATGYAAKVGMVTISLRHADNGQFFKEISPPAVLRWFIEQFDNGNKVSPFSFELEVPESSPHKLHLDKEHAELLLGMLSSNYASSSEASQLYMELCRQGVKSPPPAAYSSYVSMTPSQWYQLT
jgi:hypothetical protein